MRLMQEEEVRAFKRLRQLVELEQTLLTFTPEQVASINKKMEVNGGHFADHTEEIRAATELHRRSWIIPIIEAFELLIHKNTGTPYERFQAMSTIKEAAKDLR